MSQSDSQDIDSDLQRSIDDLEQQQQNQKNNQNDHQDDQYDQNNNNDDGDDNVRNNKKGNKQKQNNVKNHLKQKKSVLDELMPPDQQVDDSAPYVVVVQGSKSSGKSSLIRSLVKHFTKYKIDAINGTITLRSTKKQRITIIECPNDIRAMIDLSKIADIVVLIIDASLGFEMETFEFLSLLKCHGFPYIMGVLTHLDFYKESKQFRRALKKYKKRFEYEVGGNYKLFHLSRFNNGLYPKIEVGKIARYIGTSNPSMISWRVNHPFVLCDRWEISKDRNYQDEELVNVNFYGYIRGASYRMNGRIHLVGMGDFQIEQMQTIGDPCPEFKKDEKEEERQKKDDQGQSNEEKMDEGSSMSGNEGLEERKIKDMREVGKKKKKRRTLAQNERIIYAPSCNLGTLSFEHTSGFVTIPNEYIKFTRREKQNKQFQWQQQVEEGIQMVRQLQDLKQGIDEKLKKRERDFQLFQGVKIDDEIYQHEGGDNMNNYQFEDKRREIKKIKEKTQGLVIVEEGLDLVNRQQKLQYLIYQSKQPMVTYDCSKYHPEPNKHSSQQLKQLFTTGMQEDVLHQFSDENDDEQQEERKRKKIAKLMKMNIKKSKINESTNFYKKGSYIRVMLSNMKYSEFKQLNTNMPIILVRINLGEESLGFIKVNFRRHRWYTNLLKSNDPIIVSNGWRRYQTLITFVKSDLNERLRYLKYTPNYDYCLGVFYGNFNQQNTGCVFMQSINNEIKKFRIAGSGVILEINKSFDVMKKIKLIGEPYKIMKNTAFVRGMFNSNLQVSSYVGAQIKTVSGIRGQIKKMCKEGGQGTFRATFEDKILMSDIIFCRAWYKIILDRFYNPIFNYRKNNLMKTKYELRVENNISIERKQNSQYKNIERVPQVFKPFVIPKKLEGKLPFKNLEKIKLSKIQRIKKKEGEGIPNLLMTDKEKQIASLVQRLNTIKNQKIAVKQEKYKQRKRIKQAMERPKQQYYESAKKQRKSQKMASLMRKNNREQRREQRREYRKAKSKD